MSHRSDDPQRPTSAGLFAELRAWRDFTARLARRLETMTSEQDHLVLEMITDDADESDGVAPYAQFCGAAPGWLRAEISGPEVVGPWHLIDEAALQTGVVGGGWLPPYVDDPGCPNYSRMVPIAQAAELAWSATQILRKAFGVRLEAELEVSAWGPAAQSTGADSTLTS